MATARPTVTIYGLEGPSGGSSSGSSSSSSSSSSSRVKPCGSALLPSVFLSPLRPDLVRFVFTNLSKNSRQPYAVSKLSGYQTSAESWGTGRAVARIPRVPGGGTHRAGQAAFGNMCRGGGMFAPTKTWRRWHRKVNSTQRRHAVCAAVAAAALQPLVAARGHKVEEVPELPLVLSDSMQQLKKTKDACKLLAAAGCGPELQRLRSSRCCRTGTARMRNRTHYVARGPLIIYGEDQGLTRAFRNIPGVELCHVSRLNLLQLAPGGTLGRFCVWSAAALQQLQQLFSSKRRSCSSSSYALPRPLMTNADLARIVNSDEVQSVLRPQLLPQRRRKQHKNPLTNWAVRCRLDPSARSRSRLQQRQQTPGTRARKVIEKLRGARKLERRTHRRAAKAFIKGLRAAFDPPQAAAEA